MRPERFFRRRSRGGPIPIPIGVLIGLTVVASLVAAIGARNGFDILRTAMLIPAQVWRGELWRLVSWIFFEQDPISLLFACLTLYWFGRDLYFSWGARRFLAVYFGFTVAAAAGTCLLWLFFPNLLQVPYFGSWPVAEALIIAWAVSFPDRQILIYFVMPISGRRLIYVTLGGTVLFALFAGPVHFIPHFFSEGLMLLYMMGRPRWWLRLKLGKLERRRGRHLRIVERDEPPRRDPPKWLN